MSLSRKEANALHRQSLHSKDARAVLWDYLLETNGLMPEVDPSQYIRRDMACLMHVLFWTYKRILGAKRKAEFTKLLNSYSRKLPLVRIDPYNNLYGIVFKFLIPCNDWDNELRFPEDMKRTVGRLEKVLAPSFQPSIDNKSFTLSGLPDRYYGVAEFWRIRCKLKT